MITNRRGDGRILAVFATFMHISYIETLSAIFHQFPPFIAIFLKDVKKSGHFGLILATVRPPMASNGVCVSYFCIAMCFIRESMPKCQSMQEKETEQHYHHHQVELRW